MTKYPLSFLWEGIYSNKQTKCLTFAINYACIQCPIRSDEPANNSMDISTGHMVLAYMEDHLKNKQRLEQEWVALCGYEAEPSSTTVAFKVNTEVQNCTRRNIEPLKPYSYENVSQKSPG